MSMTPTVVDEATGPRVVAAPPSTAPPRGLIRKLAEVMAAVERVPKRGRNEFHRYDYATEADIVATVRGELAKRGVMLMPQVDEYVPHELGPSKKGEPRDPLVILRMTFTFVDGDTGECDARPWLGVGQDGGDKGVYKAMTGAAKYFLLKTFLMPTGDDPEIDGKKDARQSDREFNALAKAQQQADAARQAAAAPAPAIIDRAEQQQLIAAAELGGWKAADVKRLLAAHGFTKSADVTRARFAEILEALRNGTTLGSHAPAEKMPGDSQASPPAPAVINESQQRRLWTIASKSRWSKETLKAWLVDSHNIGSIKAIPTSLYDVIVESIEAGPPSAEEQPF